MYGERTAHGVAGDEQRPTREAARGLREGLRSVAVHVRGGLHHPLVHLRARSGALPQQGQHGMQRTCDPSTLPGSTYLQMRA